MRPRSALLATALIVLTSGSAAEARRDRCHVSGARTVALTAQARVFQSQDDGFYYGCDRRTGRQTVLWEQDDLYIAGNVRRAAGPFVAYEWWETPACKADCPPDVHGRSVTSVTDVRTGRTRNLSHARVYTLILRASGLVAWTVATRSGAALSDWAPGGRPALLDRGPISGVRAIKDTLWWSDEGAQRSAPFPRRD